MKAMLLAAGEGTRLKPFTDHQPKALFRLHGKTLLQIQLEKLQQAGIREVVVNVHHFSEQLVDYLNDNKNFGMQIHISDESNKLLDTGGAIKKAAAFLQGEEAFLLHNVDVVSNVSIEEMQAFHRSVKTDISIAVSARESKRKFLFDKAGKLCGWKNRQSGETKWVDPQKQEYEVEYAFSGIHIIHPTVFKEFPEEDRFSIIDFYLFLAGKYKIMAFRHDPDTWWDIGKAKDVPGLRQNQQLKKIINP